MARIIDWEMCGTDPAHAGIGSLATRVRGLLRKRNLTLEDIDLVVLNEVAAKGVYDGQFRF